ncbi:MAG TPA: shikimate dehydrogenase [Acidimicrobiales bacterium]|nr:shikimate dehydrogenase [Acidimicrobiales bacterium]
MMWRLGVAGSPIEHSLSPVLHEAGLAMAGLTGSSRRYEMTHDDAPRIRDVMDGFDALSVTMPLKGLVGEYCDELDEVAERTESVNTLWWAGGRLHGASTDGGGFIDALAAQFGFDPSGAHVVVLGAGGAARAVIDALVFAGVSSVVVHGRTAANVEAITARHANVFDFTLTLRPVDLIVNTVPMSGRITEAAVLQGVGAHTIAYDIVYEPRMTPWRALHRHHGCPSANGLGMLAYQAARQMTLWWGVPMDGARLLETLT